MMDFPPSDPEGERMGPYRMRTWPNTIAWTSISWSADLWPPDKFRVETTMQINPLVPQGYGGFLVRYQDEQNYYLLQFDGEGHYRTTLRANGEWSSAKEWANSTAINLAGQPNTIAVEDGGAQLRVYANGSLIEEFSALLPAGHIGLIAGAEANGPIEVDYLGLTLYELY